MGESHKIVQVLFQDVYMTFKNQCVNYKYSSSVQGHLTEMLSMILKTI